MNSESLPAERRGWCYRAGESINAFRMPITMIEERKPMRYDQTLRRQNAQPDAAGIAGNWYVLPMLAVS